MMIYDLVKCGVPFALWDEAGWRESSGMYTCTTCTFERSRELHV